MDDVGHSPLLKFIVADRKITSMSEPDFKIQVSFDNPNITSAVPEEQKLRHDDAANNSGAFVYNTFEANTEDSTTEIDNIEKKPDLALDQSKEDFVLTPVMTVTKEEAVFTKGDMKLQKVSVTEDISGTRIATFGQENITVVNNGDSQIYDEVFRVQRVRKQTSVPEQTESKKPKTRIPTLRFRQAVDQLKQDRNSFEDRKEPVPPQPTPRRSSIPRLKDLKHQAPSIKDSSSQRVEKNDVEPRLSDEFDKLYDEISEDQDSLDNLSIISKIEDPVKLENTFEEIIHAYEENNIQPIKVEKVRQSKIPLLKRKSEHEIEVPKQTTPAISETTYVQESSTAVNTATVEEIINDKESNIIIKEKVNKIEKVKQEENPIDLITLNNPNLKERHSGTLTYVNSMKYIENINTETLTENQNEEDIPTIRGKVNRIIKRMDSKETEVKPSKRDFGDETPKKKSVLSKIAIFERPTSAETASKEKNHSIPETSNVKLVEYIETKNDLSNDKPKIVDEVLKALPARITEEDYIKYTDNYLNKSDWKNNHDTLNIQIINTQPQVDIQSVYTAEITVVNTDEYINPDIVPYPEKSVIDPKQKTQFNHGFDIQHHQHVERKVPMESNKEVDIGVHTPNDVIQTNFMYPSMKQDLNNIENKDQNPTTDNLIPTEIESKIVCPTTIYNNQEYIDNNQNPSSNVDDNKNVAFEIDSKPTFVEATSYWNTERNISDDNQYNSKYINDIKLNESVHIDSRPVIISDIVKQEVKFEHLKVDHKTKIEDTNNGFYRNIRKDEGALRIHAYRNNESDKIIKSISLAELDLGDAVKGRVKNMIVRMNSVDRLDATKKDIINVKERPRKKSVSEKIALFERKLTPIKSNKDNHPKIEPKLVPEKYGLSEEEYTKRIEELSLAKTRYGVLDPGDMKYLELRNNGKMPALGIGTALLDPKLTRYIVQAAIDMGYRTIDTAYIYGNEKEVGEAINEKIKDGTVSRSELFIISKLWSTFHRKDLVQRACRASLDAMGLDYFDLYLIHNPMSFKEGGDPVPKIANVLQFSEYDYLDAWFGVEGLVREGLVRQGGVSNFNSQQIDRVVEKGKIKPVINQVECHPYLSQHRLDEFCQARNVKLCCFGVLGSKGTPQEHKSALPPAIDDPLVRVMAAGLEVSPAALLISYQLALGRGVIVKGSSPAHLWDNLQALTFSPGAADVSALHALNRNKRTFTFKGMGDTHRHYPFNVPF